MCILNYVDNNCVGLQDKVNVYTGIQIISYGQYACYVTSVRITSENIVPSPQQANNHSSWA